MLAERPVHRAPQDSRRQDADDDPDEERLLRPLVVGVRGIGADGEHASDEPPRPAPDHDARM